MKRKRLLVWLYIYQILLHKIFLGSTKRKILTNLFLYASLIALLIPLLLKLQCLSFFTSTFFFFSLFQLVPHKFQFLSAFCFHFEDFNVEVNSHDTNVAHSFRSIVDTHVALRCIFRISNFNVSQNDKIYI